MWQLYLTQFKSYLQLEKSLSDNSVQAYLRDIEKLISFLQEQKIDIEPQKVTYAHLAQFIVFINELGLEERSQARIISGIRAFFKFLLLEDEIKDDPSQLLETPKLTRKLPSVLNIEEIDAILNSITQDTEQGTRNKTIIEVLYGCGLRVSELVNLKLSDIYWSDEFLKVTGKGNKERLVPIGRSAQKALRIYIEEYRKKSKKVNEKHNDVVFVNNRGGKLSREMIFLMIKKVCDNAGISKTISPHTFRHSYASHLVDGGADLRDVQLLLGHESITTTEIYTHLDKEYLHTVIMSFHPSNIGFHDID